MGISSFGVASSPDGVFWTDHGTMMHPFDEGKSCPQTGSGSGSVWRGSSKSAPPWVTDAAGNRADGGTGDDDQEVFIINYSHGGIIRFMTAPTPKGPWVPVGSTTPGQGGFGPGRKPPRPQDGRAWYDGRWDTANGWPAPEPRAGGFNHYAWITGTANADLDPKSSVGHMGSVDGVNWTALPPATVTDWGSHTLTGGPMEQGGCAYAVVNQKWYCLNGFRGNWAAVDRTRGMAVFVSDKPGGPYQIVDKNPLVMSYRSCAYMPANCDAVTYFMRFWLRYDVPDPSSPPELLVVHQSYTVHDQMTYLAPLKHAVVDTDDTMRLQWWAGNEKMKGTPTTYALGPVDKLGHRKFTTPLNNRNGTVLEATSSGGCAGSLVFYGSGNDTDAFEIGVDEDLIMTVTLCTQGKYEVLETVDRAMFSADCASGGVTYRLLLRGSMVEVYVNDVLTLPIALPNTISLGGLGGFAAGVRASEIEVGVTGSWAKTESIEAWTMGLSALFPMP